MKKVYSTTGPVKKPRRRIGEFTNEIKRFKASFNISQHMSHEINFVETHRLKLA